MAVERCCERGKQLSRGAVNKEDGCQEVLRTRKMAVKRCCEQGRWLSRGAVNKEDGCQDVNKEDGCQGTG